MLCRCILFNSLSQLTWKLFLFSYKPTDIVHFPRRHNNSLSLHEFQFFFCSLLKLVHCKLQQAKPSKPTTRPLEKYWEKSGAKKYRRSQRRREIVLLHMMHIQPQKLMQENVSDVSMALFISLRTNPIMLENF